MSGGAGWIGVDLDGTLAHYGEWDGGRIGKPIGPMVERVKAWLAEGIQVRIVTARVCALFDFRLIKEPEKWERQAAEALEQNAKIRAWCLEHLGQELPVTAVKDFDMVELWDDRCIQVVKNTGEPLLRTEDLARLLGRVIDKRRVR